MFAFHKIKDILPMSGLKGGGSDEECFGENVCGWFFDIFSGLVGFG